MAKPLIADAVWEQIKPLLPLSPERRLGGRPRLTDRAALSGILFVLQANLPWEDLPQALGCGSGMTCWRRLREWEQAGVWPSVQAIMLAQIPKADRFEWSRLHQRQSRQKAQAAS